MATRAAAASLANTSRLTVLPDFCRVTKVVGVRPESLASAFAFRE
jgi:hypothetical protein